MRYRGLQISNFYACKFPNTQSNICLTYVAPILTPANMQTHILSLHTHTPLSAHANASTLTHGGHTPYNEHPHVLNPTHRSLAKQHYPKANRLTPRATLRRPPYLGRFFRMFRSAFVRPILWFRLLLAFLVLFLGGGSYQIRRITHFDFSR